MLLGAEVRRGGWILRRVIQVGLEVQLSEKARHSLGVLVSALSSQGADAGRQARKDADLIFRAEGSARRVAQPVLKPFREEPRQGVRDAFRNVNLGKRVLRRVDIRHSLFRDRCRHRGIVGGGLVEEVKEVRLDLEGEVPGLRALEAGIQVIEKGLSAGVGLLMAPAVLVKL